MREYYVYILRCKDGSYYTGITNNLTARYWQHEMGLNVNSYTYNKRPVNLVYSSSFLNVWQAISWEKQIKRWNRKKKLALIEGRYEVLPELSSKLIQSIAMVRRAHHDNIIDVLDS